jgi:hypothetical protein
MPDFAIETNQLSKRFGDVVAVDSVNLYVKRGEIYGSSVSMEREKFEVTETACLHLAAGTGENAQTSTCRVHYPGVLPRRCVRRVSDLSIRIAQDMFYCTFNSILCSYGFSD